MRPLFPYTTLFRSHASSRSEPCDGQPYLLRSRHLPKLPLPSQSLHPPTSLKSLLESWFFQHHWLPKVPHTPIFLHADLHRAELGSHPGNRLPSAEYPERSEERRVGKE